MRLLILAPALLLAVPAAAQTDGANAVESILRAIRLPTVTVDVRESGTPEDAVREILRDARVLRIPPGETEQVLTESAEAMEEHGPIDNFGSFVQSKLREGLRGRALAEAIHAEHRARGKGKGHLKEKHGGKHLEKHREKAESRRLQNEEKMRSGKGKRKVPDHGHDHDGHDHEGHDHDGHDHDGAGNKAGKAKKGGGQ